MTDLPTYQDIVDAADTLAGQAIRTPLMRSDFLDEMLDAKIYFKPECLQRTGSFKFRGAYNAMQQIPETAKETGVVACSSGNHAQGVAEAAQLKGYPATIIMPSDAPEAKKQRTMRSGAEIVEYDRIAEDREALMERTAAEKSSPVIHPYENSHVIAGQGTVGLEISEDMKELARAPDHVLVCAGGGGLMAGIVLSVSHHFPDALVHPVEPEGYDDQKRSHEAGERLGGNQTSPNICDAIITPMPGKVSFEICKGRVGGGLAVNENEVLEAVAFAFRELKLVVEPGGAVCLAALLSKKIDVRGKTVVATLSGGNIDDEVLARALANSKGKTVSAAK